MQPVAVPLGQQDAENNINQKRFKAVFYREVTAW
jgi:hypothetical protein